MADFVQEHNVIAISPECVALGKVNNGRLAAVLAECSAGAYKADSIIKLGDILDVSTTSANEESSNKVIIRHREPGGSIGVARVFVQEEPDRQQVCQALASALGSAWTTKNEHRFQLGRLHFPTPYWLAGAIGVLLLFALYVTQMVLGAGFSPESVTNAGPAHTRRGAAGRAVFLIIGLLGPGPAILICIAFWGLIGIPFALSLVRGSRLTIVERGAPTK